MSSHSPKLIPDWSTVLSNMALAGVICITLDRTINTALLGYTSGDHSSVLRKELIKSVQINSSVEVSLINYLSKSKPESLSLSWRFWQLVLGVRQ